MNMGFSSLHIFLPFNILSYNFLHVDYVHVLLDLLLDIVLFINVSSNSIFSYPQIPLVYFFLLCLRVAAFAVILYSTHVEPSLASIFLSFRVFYKDNHITYKHSFLSSFVIWILLITVLIRTSWKQGDQCRRRQPCFVRGLGEEALRILTINVIFTTGLFCFLHISFCKLRVFPFYS